MWIPSPRTGALLVLSGILALSSVACNSDDSASQPSASTATAPASPQPRPAARLVKHSAKKTNAPVQNPPATSENYNRALDVATGAINISKSAVSRQDWILVASQWQQAINLLKSVPAASSQHASAQSKIAQYQGFLADAKARATPPPKQSQPGDLNPAFFSIPIKGKLSGTPIIDVNFNGTRKFEMLFDTGANVTLITRQIAYSLKLKPLGVTKIGVADGAEVTVYKTALKSVETDGRLKRNMAVVVAPPAMPIGLLGQDFYDGYDITIKEDVIEFRRR